MTAAHIAHDISNERHRQWAGKDIVPDGWLDAVAGSSVWLLRRLPPSVSTSVRSLQPMALHKTSDCGNVFMWDKETTQVVQYFHGDDGGVVSCAVLLIKRHTSNYRFQLYIKLIVLIPYRWWPSKS